MSGLCSLIHYNYHTLPGLEAYPRYYSIIVVNSDMLLNRLSTVSNDLTRATTEDVSFSMTVPVHTDALVVGAGVAGRQAKTSLTSQPVRDAESAHT